MRLTPLETRHPLSGAVRPVTTALLAETYLAPLSPDYAPGETMRAMDAPWSASLEVAPNVVAAVVERALVNLMHAVPTLDPCEADIGNLKEGRAKAHLKALRELWMRMGDGLPEDLAVCRHVLNSSGEDALEALPVFSPPCPFASPLEAALDARLTAHHGRVEPASEPTQDLADFAAKLGTSQATWIGDRVTVHGLRDAAAEATFVAASIQSLLDRGEMLDVSEVGVLLPEKGAYEDLLAEEMNTRGLALTGVKIDAVPRDTVCELLTSLFGFLSGSAGRLDLAAILVHPALNLDRDLAHRLARICVAEGQGRMKRAADENCHALLDLLRPVSTGAQTKARLLGFVEMLRPGRLAEEVAARVHRVLPLCDQEPDWTSMRAMAAGERETPTRDLHVDAVPVFRERQLPWRRVTHLFVIGASNAAYPEPPASDPFFTEVEIEEIRATTGLVLPGRQATLSRRVELFRRQLASVSNKIVMTVPSRDLAGKPIAPSTAIAFMAQAAGRSNAGDLIVEVDSLLPSVLPFMSTEVPKNTIRPILPVEGNVEFARDLSRLGESNTPLKQSPSSLETLAVSPLAWLLQMLDARDRTWLAETPDARVMGTLLHVVLEELFPEGIVAPVDAPGETQVAEAVENAITKNAPWIADAVWHPERARLMRGAGRASTGFAAFLNANQAKVVKNESWLSGQLGSLPITGRADTILSLPDGRLLVIDHKSGGSASRREQLTRGWDLQAKLYGRMLRTTDELAELVSDARVVTGYHILSDGTVLLDENGDGIARAERISGDNGREGMPHIEAALAELAEGRLRLNRAGDIKAIQKERGVTPYALIDGSLAKFFILPDEEAPYA